MPNSKPRPLVKAAIGIAIILALLGGGAGCFYLGMKAGAFLQYQYDRQLMQQYFRGQPQEDTGAKFQTSGNQ